MAVVGRVWWTPVTHVKPFADATRLGLALVRNGMIFRRVRPRERLNLGTLNSMRRELSFADQARLTWVRAEPGADLSYFPDFLIIGPQRTGTTWLHAHLRDHPEVMLSEPKEVLFFNRLKSPNHPRFQSADLSWYLKFFREPLWRRAWKDARCRRRFGVPYLPKARGEASASYAVLDADVIDEIGLLNPDIKAILMVRDPLERAWSHAKKDLARNRARRLEEVAEHEFLRFFQDEYQLRCARYADNFAKWKAMLKPGHLFVGRFDDIALRPRELLLEVMSFLGVESSGRFVGADVGRAVNPTARDRIPARYREVLEELLGGEQLKLQRNGELQTSGVR